MLLACMLKGAARYVAPLAFVGATIGGTVLHLGAANIPMSEALVALSVVIGGVLVLSRRYPGAFALSAIFAVSGVLHGYAYGESIVGAETTPLLAYLIGFAAIQYALIVGGVLGLDKIASKSEKARQLAARVGSWGALLTGGAFLAMGVV
jgi:urease accessory protein